MGKNKYMVTYQLEQKAKKGSTHQEPQTYTIEANDTPFAVWRALTLPGAITELKHESQVLSIAIKLISDEVWEANKAFAQYVKVAEEAANE